MTYVTSVGCCLQTPNKHTTCSCSAAMNSLLFCCVVLLGVQQTQAKGVFAHFMMGNSYGYSQATFQADMVVAQGLGIDAFALNIGSDSWTWDRTYKAYLAAAAVNFKVFLSFDMNYHTSVGDINNWIVNFCGTTYASQYRYNNLAVVSTFGGEYVNLGYANSNAGWQAVKTSLPFSIFFIPEWSSFNANNVYSTNPVMDGFFSWAAWPGPTEDATTLTGIDNIYQTTKGTKAYMAPVSPYFFTHLSYKNYLYKTESLWIDRWLSLLNTKPDFIEIVTWNDWGESHYIAQIDSNSGDLPAGSAAYVTGFTHVAFQNILPAFITAFKNGQTTPTITKDVVIIWHRENFVDGVNCNDGIGTPTVQNRDTSPSTYAIDQVIGNTLYVVSLLTSAAQITVTNQNAASNTATYSVNAGTTIERFTMTQAGAFQVTVKRGSTTVGTATSPNVASSGGSCNYNVYVTKVV